MCARNTRVALCVDEMTSKPRSSITQQVLTRVMLGYSLQHLHVFIHISSGSRRLGYRTHQSIADVSSKLYDATSQDEDK